MIRAKDRKRQGSGLAWSWSWPGMVAIVVALSILVFQWIALIKNNSQSHSASLQLATSTSQQPQVTAVAVTSCDENHGTLFFGLCMCQAGYTGKDCSRKLANPPGACTSESDACLVHPHFGVAQVPLERWKHAQSYEKGYWDVVIPQKIEDGDHGNDMVEGFKRYNFLPRNLGRVAEMGAGPYTQLKFMLSAAEPGNPFIVDEVTLIDPLINYYLTNPDCPYKDNHLEGVAGPVKYMEAGGEELTDTLEEFDTLIMLNTLEHCRDAYAVLRNVHAMLKTGGILIFWDTIWDRQDPEAPLDYYRHLHPIRLTSQVFAPFVTAFEPIFQDRQEQRAGTSLFFSGRKL